MIKLPSGWNLDFFKRDSTWINLGALAAAVLNGIDAFGLDPEIRNYVWIACTAIVTISQSYTRKDK